MAAEIDRLWSGNGIERKRILDPLPPGGKAL
jgi:hypothetical protein